MYLICVELQVSSVRVVELDDSSSYVCLTLVVEIDGSSGHRGVGDRDGICIDVEDLWVNTSGDWNLGVINQGLGRGLHAGSESKGGSVGSFDAYSLSCWQGGGDTACRVRERVEDDHLDVEEVLVVGDLGLLCGLPA